MRHQVPSGLWKMGDQLWKYSEPTIIIMKSFVLVIILFVQPVFCAELPIAPPQIGRDRELRLAADLYRSGWKDSASELAKPLADKGDKDAWFLLGLLLEEEAPARLSRGQAMDLAYRKAAAAGHPEAELRRAVVRIAASADETAKNAGVRGLEAAAKNDPVACRILGEVYLRGYVDGKRDVEKASASWKRAAELGDVPSWVLLGKLAEGVFPSDGKPDPVAALKWYRQAAGAGNSTAALRLGELLSGADAEEGKQWIAKAISSGAVEGHVLLGDLVANDKPAALHHYQKGAEAGDSRSMVKLAALLLEDDARRADGIRWLERASASRNADAAARLGGLYLKDQPVKSYPYLIEAARGGVPQAQADLASLYLDGRLGKPDPSAAVTWLTEAMKSGNAEFQYRLGFLHEQGIGTPINYANAGTLYTMACNKGLAAAASGIARLSAEGLGIPVNPVQAWAYASLAIERGDPSAGVLLADLNQKVGDAGRELGRETLAKLREGVNPTRVMKN
jgi:TPR repeat protein